MNMYFVGIFLVVCQCLLLTTSSSTDGDDGKDACAEFRDKACRCEEGGVVIICSTSENSDPIDEFPLKDKVLETFKSLMIKEVGRFTTLNSSHLRQFPNLEVLRIEDGRLETITDDAFTEVPKLKTLDLSNNRITPFPKIAGLTNLRVLNLQGNRIQSIEYDRVKQCIELLLLNLNYNNIKVLRNGTFRDSCRLSELLLSHNEDLHTIEEDFFNGLFIRILNLAHTKISQLPLKGLSPLKELNLDGCKRIKHFPLANEVYNEDVCTNKTFPFLEKIQFEYHAHCCSYNDFRPLVSGYHRDIPDQCAAKRTKQNKRNAPATIMSSPATPSFSTSNPSISLVTSTATVCWKGTTLIEENGTSTTGSSLPTTSDIEKCCTTTEIVITPTFTEVEACSATSVVSLKSSISPTTSSAAVFTTSSPTPTAEALPTDCGEYPPAASHQCIHCTTTDLCQSESCKIFSSVCEARRRRKRSIQCIESNCASSECKELQHLCGHHGNRQKRLISTAESVIVTTNSKYISKPCSTFTMSIVPSVSFTLACNSVAATISTVTQSDSSIVLFTTTMPTTSTMPTMTPTEALPTDCGEYPPAAFHHCIHCTTIDLCQSEGCKTFSSVCEAGRRRKRSIQCIESNCASSECKELQHLCGHRGDRQKKDADVGLSCSSCTVGAIIIDASIGTATTTLTTKISTTSTTMQQQSPSSTVGDLIGSLQPTCSHFTFIRPGLYNEHENITASCYPGNDPFNPCFHIMDDDILRVAIWLVLLIAIIGNGLVIVLTILHWAVRYRSYKKEPNLLFILYLNLAVADLFMGIYLMTIAIIDIETKGHYSSEAVEWQTGASCNFAGFCAIFSSVLSVYSLLFITVERVYSIKFALEMKHFKKKWVFLFMVFGWVSAFLLAVLPIFDVNNYGRVSICLPFETRDTKDIVYIAFVLVITGIASFIILLSYIYLFYLVGCSAAKKKLTRSFSGKEELKLAFRMSLLIVTDFATWGPIALFGLTAAFGYPLINDIKAAKILMVFIFPLNSCLNPILYSFSTRLFRNNVLNLFRKCGMCKLCDQINKSLETRSSDKDSSAYQSSNVDNPISGTNGYHGRRRSTQMSILSRLTSISSLGSDNMSGSRRGSTFSGSSLEDGVPSQNSTTNVSNGNQLAVQNGNNYIQPNGSIHSPLSRSNWDSTGSLSNVPSRLKSLPEESEEGDTNYVISTRKDSTDSNCSTSFRKIALSNEPSSLSKESIDASKRRRSLPTILDSNYEDTELSATKRIPRKESKAFFIDHKSAVIDNAETQQMEVTFF